VVGSSDWLDGWRVCTGGIARSFSPVPLRKQNAYNKSHENSSRPSNKDSEQWTLICLRCENDWANKPCEKTREANDDSTRDAVSERGAPSGCFVTWHTI